MSLDLRYSDVDKRFGHALNQNFFHLMKVKYKKAYVCTSCGVMEPAWAGQCKVCGEWNTLVEEFIPTSKMTQSSHSVSQIIDRTTEPILITDITSDDVPRVVTYSEELNRVLGGGIVPASVILLGGQPGIGKSTLILQIAAQLTSPVLYVSGEESVEQIRRRASRIQCTNDALYLYAESKIESIIQHAESIKPALIVIDSIQTMYSESLDRSSGHIVQIKECAYMLMRYAKSSHIPILLIGHITKDGQLGGPKLLEHIVDVVLYFEGDRHHQFRMLRGHKNRYGSTEEIGIFEMKSDGLREVTNPSQLLLVHHKDQLPGSAIAVVTEGQKSLLIEAQALVSSAVYGNPQRSPTGFELRRLQMLLAVLERRVGLPFGQHDVFLNIAGGIRTQDPATDLAIVAALWSAHYDRSILNKYGFAGEVGLSGEVRPIQHLERRIAEAERMGLTRLFVPDYGLEALANQDLLSIELVGVRYIGQLKNFLFS